MPHDLLPHFFFFFAKVKSKIIVYECGQLIIVGLLFGLSLLFLVLWAVKFCEFNRHL